ncbi:hypothetical protein EJB05_13824, partial [Eragrostis curvula]
MFDMWSVVGWWDKWQLRILVLGSLGIQWFLLVAAPLRKYTIWRCFRLCIWLAYISSDALAIYALATLFNRHARGSSSSSCEGVENNKEGILEVLWAPVLLIHLGGQEELTAYSIEDNELWTRHTVTLVSQVAVALYAFCKSWTNPSDWKLLASAILLFIIGVLSFSEKPWALKRASINRLASVSAVIQGTKKRTRLAVYLDDLLLSDWYNFFTKSGSDDKSSLPEGVGLYNCCSFTESSKKQPAERAASEEENVGLSEGDKVYMVLSDMSLLAAADDLVRRGRAGHVRDVLRPLSTKAEKQLKRWLRGAFGLIYTRANLAVTRTYLVYHVLVVPILHIAAITLFATSDKDGYGRTDVKITYILLCLTAALDVFAVFIRQLLYRAMSATSVPALCETVPGYNLMEAVLQRRQKAIGPLVKCATSLGCKEEYFEYFKFKEGGRDDYTLYKNVSEMVLADLVSAQGRDLANYRVFPVQYSASSHTAEVEEQPRSEIMEQQQSSPGAANWALTEEQQKKCGPMIRSTLSGSFDRSVLVWHIATDLCYRVEAGTANNEEETEAHRLRRKCTEAISSYMARLLNFHPEMLLTGSRQHLVSEAMDELESILGLTNVDNSGKLRSKEDLLTIIDEWAGIEFQVPTSNKDEDKEAKSFFHIPVACSLAKELRDLEPTMRWYVMYRVWLGMLFYSASMCRGYLHAKSLGEGGEFLSYVWLVLSLKGAKTLADKLQMLEVKGDDKEPMQHPVQRPPLPGSENKLNPLDAPFQSPMP